MVHISRGIASTCEAAALGEKGGKGDSLISVLFYTRNPLPPCWTENEGIYSLTNPKPSSSAFSLRETPWSKASTTELLPHG